MKIIENNCCDCDTYCISCGKKYEEVIYCDICEENYVDDYGYTSDDLDYCFYCKCRINDIMEEENLDRENAIEVLKERYR